MTVDFRNEIKKDMRLSGFNVHDQFKHLDVPELREICNEERSPFVLAAINVTGDMNMGSIIRTACLFGAQKVIVFGRKKFDRRGLVGSQNYIDVEFVPCLNDDLSIDDEMVVAKLDEANYQIIMIEQNGHQMGTFNWNYLICGKMTPLFMVGNENRGIPDNVINAMFDKFKLTQIVSIPQRGVIRSHNVSVATGIVLSAAALHFKWI